MVVFSQAPEKYQLEKANVLGPLTHFGQAIKNGPERGRFALMELRCWRDFSQVSGDSWISTRRFCSRPWAVALDAIGRVLPKPVTAKRR